MKKLMLAVIIGVIICPAAVADVSVFKDDFSANTIGAKWIADVSGEDNHAWISEDFGVAFTLVNSGYARLYSKPFTALGNVTFLGQVMAAGSQLPTQWNEISIYNSADPSKYFKVSYGTFSQRLRFEDSGQLIEEIPWQAQPYYNRATYGLVFNGSEWAFFQDSSLVKLYQTSSMQGANSYYVGLGTWDASSLNNFSAFDNVCIKATAVPEPVSTALFLLGGATLAVRRLRRK